MELGVDNGAQDFISLVIDWLLSFFLSFFPPSCSKIQGVLPFLIALILVLYKKIPSPLSTVVPL